VGDINIRGTKVLERNATAFYNPARRRACNEGGTSSSKTYSIMQLLTLLASSAKAPFLISVVSESMPHLRRGCIRDFQTIMGEAFDPARYNKTIHTYQFGHGEMEFFPADEPAKMRGGRRKVLYINECNNVAYRSYQELDIRTELFTFLDWNPVAEFWAHQHGIVNAPETEYIHSTYLDARKVLPAAVVTNIEDKRDKDPNWWNVYGLGRLGKVEGLVFPAFQQEEDLPEGGHRFYGLDFGYTNDPTALVENVIKGDTLHSRQLIYETGLTNDAIAYRMAETGVRKHYDEIWADGAEPKSIEELCQHGYNVKAAPKGPGSVEHGHQLVLQYRQYWTADSLDCIKEQRNFKYIEDKDGRLTNKTSHLWSHGMDARRYGVTGASAPVDREDVEIYDAMQLVGGMDIR